MTAATYNRKRSGYECVILWRQTKIFFMTLAIVQTMTNPSWFPDRESTRKYRKIKSASIPRVFQLKKHHLPNSSLSSRGHYLALLFRWTAVGEGVPRHFQDPLSRGSLPIRAATTSLVVSFIQKDYLYQFPQSILQISWRKVVVDWSHSRFWGWVICWRRIDCRQQRACHIRMTRTLFLQVCLPCIQKWARKSLEPEHLLQPQSHTDPGPQRNLTESIYDGGCVGANWNMC